MFSSEHALRLPSKSMPCSVLYILSKLGQHSANPHFIFLNFIAVVMLTITT